MAQDGERDRTDPDFTSKAFKTIYLVSRECHQILRNFITN